MKLDLRTEAAARAMAMKAGALTPEEAAQWADSVIMDEQDFDPRLIDVSLADSVARSISALNAFGPAPERSEVAAMTMRFFHAALAENKCDFRKVARMLFHMAMDGYMPAPEMFGAMSTFWDDLDLAIEGIHGDPEAIKAEMLKFLADAAEGQGKA